MWKILKLGGVLLGRANFENPQLVRCSPWEEHYPLGIIVLRTLISSLCLVPIVLWEFIFDAHLTVCEQASNADDDDVVITKTLFSPMVGDDCCICLSHLVLTNYVTTACGHHIHRRCFDRLPAESRRTREELMQARAFHFNPRIMTKVVRCPMCRTYLFVKQLTFGYEVVTSVLD